MIVPADPPSLDPVIHAQARLRVTVTLSVLNSGDRITFPRLQQLLGMTAGNLSTHLRKLEEAGYVAVTKAHRRRTPVTYVALTRSGRRAFVDYTAALRALLGPTPPSRLRDIVEPLPALAEAEVAAPAPSRPRSRPHTGAPVTTHPGRGRILGAGS